MSIYIRFRKLLSSLLGNNTFMMILSVLIAIGLWVLVTTTVNTETTVFVRNVPITFTNTNDETEYSVITQDKTSVDISVYGKRSVVGVLTAEDFNVTADYSNIVDAGSYTLDISVSPVKATSDYSISSYSHRKVDVVIDKLITQRYEIQTELVKATVADGYVLQKPVISKTEAILTGPKSEIDQITSVVAKMTVGGQLNETRTRTVPLEFRNPNGEKTETQYVKTDTESVEMTVSVLKEKIVDITFKFTGVPSGFNPSVLSYTLSQDTLHIAGAADVVNDMKSVDIGYVDIKKLTLDGTAEIPIVLPGGITNVEETDTVTVTFDFSGYIQKLFKTTDITVVGSSSKYDITVLTKSVNNINIIGARSDVLAITSSGIVAKVDLSTVGELTVGTQTVPVSIVLTSKNRAWAIGEYTVNISVKEK